MEAKLLFASGETAVDERGKEVIIDLARVLGNRDDLDIVVEGHTDTDAFSRAKYPRNNWDLSVLRATSVIEIMLANSDLNPESVMAAGRSQFNPVDPNDKAKNRRIEVILSPKLDELLEMVSD
jgi:chemotaxis protein MotB